MKSADIHKRLGKAIRKSRLRLDISQQELAKRAGLHRTYISDLERGTRNISVCSVGKIAEALEIPIGDLFDFSYEQPVQPAAVRNLSLPVPHFPLGHQIQP